MITYIFLIISIILLFFVVFLWIKLSSISIQKNTQLQIEQKKLDKIKKDKQQYLKDFESLLLKRIAQQKQINLLQEQYEDLQNKIEQKTFNIKKYYDTISKQAQDSFDHYEEELDRSYKKIETQFNLEIEKIKLQRESVQADLDQLKNVYKAAAAAKIREQEEQNKLSFYQIHLNDKQIADVSKLQAFKSNLSDPTLVSKVIWSSYVMKPTSEMCKRVLNTSSPVCGIYKITNRITGQIYIGQSVNIAERWKTHIKAGLGIDASATNKLYNNMQQTGVFSFTFELLEKCTKDKLNEKERFWIDMYASNQAGLNMTKGNR